MQAVWAKGLLHEKNIHLTFQYKLTPKHGTKLQLAASNLYRLFINGTLVGYGPARAAHGYSRVDCCDLTPWAGKLVRLSVEVYSAHINTFYTVDEPPFFAAELRQDGILLADASNFSAYRTTDRVQKVRRFSYQRAFTEVYRMQHNPDELFSGHAPHHHPVETVPVPMNRLLPRHVSYPTLEKQTAVLVEHGTVQRTEQTKPWRDRSDTLVDNIRYKGFPPAEQTEEITAEVRQFRYTPAENADGSFPLSSPSASLCSASAQSGESVSPSDALQNPGDWHFPPLTYGVYDFSRTLTGFFDLNVRTETETTLYIVFDEVLTHRGELGRVHPFRNNCCNIIKYTLAPGQYHLLSFEANSARFASVIVAEGTAEITDFGMVRYENPDAARFRWDCGDQELNDIVQAAVHTFAQNAVDVLTDCPGRERAGWLCDSYFSGRAEALFTGENRVERSFLENYALHAPRNGFPAGMLPMCYPADFPDNCYIPNWSMWYILELKNYVERTGDAEMHTLSRAKVLGLVDFFAKYENEYGLLENLDSWVFVEWSKCNDPEYTRGVNFPSNMLWAAALDAAADLYDLPGLRVKAEAMRNTIRTLAWNGQFFEDNAVRTDDGKLTATGHTTETCQYYAFFFGIAAPDTHPGLSDRMRTAFGPRRDASAVYPEVFPSNAFIGNYLRLGLLLRYGCYEQALQECRDFFADMARLTGTLWEHSALSASLNHGFASMAAVYIDECMKRLHPGSL